MVMMWDTPTTAQPFERLLTDDHCYTEFLLSNRKLHGPCMLAIFSKILGYVIIGTQTISQIPQIVKILRTRNASGVSLFSMLLMLQASSSIVAFAVLKQYPVNTWGENLIVMVENLVLVCLLLCYNDRPIAAVVFMFLYVIVMLVLILPILPTNFLYFLYILSMPAISISKMIQIFVNHKNHGTGQLSATSSFLYIFQSFGRLTTSIVLLKDFIMILTFIFISAANTILMTQVLYYRKKTKKVS